jgi:hypothetical protein
MIRSGVDLEGLPTPRVRLDVMPVFAEAVPQETEGENVAWGEFVRSSQFLDRVRVTAHIHEQPAPVPQNIGALRNLA